MNATTTTPETDPLAGLYGIDVPGTEKVITMWSREKFNASDAYAEQMAELRHGMDNIKDGNILAAVAADSNVALGLVLQDAETATDIIEYAQQELPPLIFRAWILSDYYAERMGQTNVLCGGVFETVYERDGIQFLGNMLLQLLKIAERKQCVADGLPYEGPATIDGAALIEYAESLRDEYELDFCYPGRKH